MLHLRQSWNFWKSQFIKLVLKCPPPKRCNPPDLSQDYLVAICLAQWKQHCYAASNSKCPWQCFSHFTGAVDKLTGVLLTVNYTHFLLKANDRTSLLPHGTGTKTDSQSASLKYLAATTVMPVCAECDPYWSMPVPWRAHAIDRWPEHAPCSWQHWLTGMWVAWMASNWIIGV